MHSMLPHFTKHLYNGGLKAKTNTAGRSDLPTKSDPNVGSSREPPVRADRAEAQGFFHTVAVQRKPEHMCLAQSRRR